MSLKTRQKIMSVIAMMLSFLLVFESVAFSANRPESVLSQANLTSSVRILSAFERELFNQDEWFEKDLDLLITYNTIRKNSKNSISTYADIGRSVMALLMGFTFLYLASLAPLESSSEFFEASFLISSKTTSSFANLPQLVKLTSASVVFINFSDNLCKAR